MLAVLLVVFPVAPLLVSATGEPVRARHAMVVTDEDHATRVGLRILKDDGNAVDAAIAVGFALAVTYPRAGNLSGGGFMLVRLRDGGSTFFDFRERAPSASTRDMYFEKARDSLPGSIVGYRAAGVPGTVRGFDLAWRKFGSKPWAELVRPAKELAEKGFPVSHSLARSLRGARAKLEKFPESRRIFLRDGRLFEPGDRLLQPELGATLGRIAEAGADGFYEGPTAELLSADMSRNDGLITKQDLGSYVAVERQPLRGSYRGYEILSAPPPSSGGAGVIHAGRHRLNGCRTSGRWSGSRLDVRQAIEGPRFHHQFWEVERLGFSPDTLELLRKRGHVLNVRGGIANGHAIHIDADAGWLFGAPDSRSHGSALGY